MDLSFRHENLLNTASRVRCGATANTVLTGWQPTFPSFWHYLGSMLRVPTLSSKYDPIDFLGEVIRIWRRYGDCGWADLAQYTFERSGDGIYFPPAGMAAPQPHCLAKHHPAVARADHQGRHSHAQGARPSSHHP